MRQGLFATYWKKWYLSFLVSALCFLGLLRFTWLKWGDLIIDTGREAYVPLALISGRMLYRDIFYLYGPIPPYFNAFLFKIFGSSINTLVLSGVIAASFTGILIYRISRVFLDAAMSALAVLTFLFVFAFGHYYYAGIFNFIVPYSYPAVYAALFSLGALYLFYKWINKGVLIFTYASSICAVLALLSKIEIGAAILLALFICAGIYSRKNKIMSLLIFSAFPVFAAGTTYYIFFVLSEGMIGRSNLRDVFLSNVNTGNLFSMNLFGSGDFFKSGMVIAKTSIYYVLLCAFFISGGYLAGYTGRSKNRFLKPVAYFLIIALVFSAARWFLEMFFAYYLQYRALPLILLIMSAVFLIRFWKDKANARYALISGLSLFSFFLMPRIFLKAWAGQFGFYLLVPAMIVYYVFFLKVIPDFLKQEKVRNFYRLCFIFLSALFIVSHFNISRFFYENRTLEISSERGRLYVLDRKANYINKELIDFLAKNTRDDETLAVFPEGVFINFLSKRENPLYYYQYLPVDLVRESLEDDIIKEMEIKKIDYVVIHPRNVAEYGYVAFGYDYGKNITAVLISRKPIDTGGRALV